VNLFIDYDFKTVMNNTNEIQKIAKKLKESSSILFITGAGLSADSGLPTYRGIGGIYNDNNTEDGYSIEEALSGKMLQQHPEITWKYLAQVEQAGREASFNIGHEIITKFESLLPRVWILTQNIDGFHRAAGSKNIIDIHGDIHFLECTQCNDKFEIKNFLGFEMPPLCKKCDGNIRPQVVLFGEMLPTDKLSLYQQQLEQGFDIIFSIGTTSVFPYISAPIYQANHNTLTIEINPSQTEVSSVVKIKINEKAKDFLPQLWAAVSL